MKKLLLLGFLITSLAFSQVKISELPAASSAATTDEFPSNQSGTTRKITTAQILAAGITAGTTNQAAYYSNTNILSGNPFVTFPNSGTTVHINDTTATTGVTQLKLTSGAGQSFTPLLYLVPRGGLGGTNKASLAWTNTGAPPGFDYDTTRGAVYFVSSQEIKIGFQDNRFSFQAGYDISWSANSDALGTQDTGIARQSAGLLRVTNGSTGIGQIRARTENSATEPVNCTSAVYGQTYFDTGDVRLCVCVNDGTDDEWVKSDDYSHATGHCTP